MIRTQVYLPDDLHRELKLLAQRTGRNFSSLIREGAKKIIESEENNDRDLTKFIGQAKTKTRTNSTKAIKEYYESLV